MKTEELLAGIRESKTLDELKAHLTNGIAINEYDFTDEEFGEIQAATRAKKQLLEYQSEER
jgi:hypothetical protein